MIEAFIQPHINMLPVKRRQMILLDACRMELAGSEAVGQSSRNDGGAESGMGSIFSTDGATTNTRAVFTLH